ncbi:MAG: hypothetical protein LBM75_05745 [Myxococcales bacterium]|nr:hypothetical protein [Myxococcales bacterium]
MSSARFPNGTSSDADLEEVALEDLEPLDLEDDVEEAEGVDEPSLEVSDALLDDGVEPLEAEPSSLAMSSVSVIDVLIDEAVGPRAGHADGAPPCIDPCLFEELCDCLSGKRHHSPASGQPPADEWLGHLLLGYAPFEVCLGDKVQAGSVEFSPVPRGH